MVGLGERQMLTKSSRDAISGHYGAFLLKFVHLWNPLNRWGAAKKHHKSSCWRDGSRRADMIAPTDVSGQPSTSSPRPTAVERPRSISHLGRCSAASRRKVCSDHEMHAGDGAAP